MEYPDAHPFDVRLTRSDILTADGHFTDQLFAALIDRRGQPMAEAAGAQYEDILKHFDECASCRQTFTEAKDAHMALNFEKDPLLGDVAFLHEDPNDIKQRLSALQREAGLTAKEYALKL